MRLEEGEVEMGERKFRSNWAPRILDPTPKSFVPFPRSRYEEVEVKPVETLPEAPAEMTEVEFPVADALLNILDRANDYRAYISKDGACYDRWNQVMGYIDLDEHTTGSPDLEFWGSLEQQMGNECVIMDKDDNQIGKLDMGRAYISTENGSTIAELDNTGAVTGHAGTYCGQFEGFTYHQMKIIALYLLIIDAGMYDEVDG